MYIADKIKTAEEKYLEALEEFFKSRWCDTFLPSHDISHHIRVWNYSKELLEYISGYGSPCICPDPEKLLIACCLHDLGMAENNGIRHGMQSSRLCRQFLLENNLAPAKFRDVVYAIRYHDRKDHEYTEGKYDLMTLLNAADDLDAFGITGIYRYAEICLTRGISFGSLGSVILKSAGERFLNFETVFGKSGEITVIHRQRYLVLKDFYNSYNIKSKECDFNGPPEGECGVIRIISEMITERIPPENILSHPEKLMGDDFIFKFFRCLYGEVKSGNGYSNK